MPKKKSTEHLIEELVRAVKRGFDDAAAHMATKQQLQLVADNLDLARADIHDMKLTLGPLVRHVVAMEEKVSHLEKRVDRIERKVGLAS